MKCFIYNLCILFLLISFSACNSYQKEVPKAIDGFLDLKEWNIEKDGDIALDGTWEFYWNKLYTPRDFQKDSLPPGKQFLEVPGVWNNISVSNKNLSGQGFATYRLKIRLNHTYEELSVKFLDEATSYQAWINNNPVASNGKVSLTPEEMKPQLLPQVKSFRVDTDRLEITIQVANNFHHKGGLWESIRIGTIKQNMRTREKSIILTMFLAGTLFILFIYHLWIFLFRRTEKAALWFSILCLFILIRTLLVNERIIYQFFPGFNLSIGYRIEYITIFSLAFFFGSYFYYLYEKALSKTALKIIGGITCIEMIIVLFTKAQFYTSFVLAFQIIFILELFYFFIMTFVQLANKKRGALLLLFSWLVALVFGMNDALYLNLVIHTGVIAHYAFFIFILTQAYILSDKIVMAFNTIENLSDELNLVNRNLEQKVENRTHELQKEKEKVEVTLSELKATQEQLIDSEKIASIVKSHQAVSNERLRISRELHDEIGATLSSISIFSQAAILKNESGNLADSKNILERIGETSREVMGELNDTVWLINPGYDNLEEIIQRITNYALPLCTTNNTHLEIKAAVSVEGLDLSVEKRKAIYLIIKEAVNNSLKYAAAKNLVLRFEKNHNALRISIKDDGCGFAKNNLSAGNGLSNMRQRSKDVNGKIVFDSVQQKGTEIILEVPLTNIGD